MDAPMTPRRRRRLAPFALAAGVLGSAILGLGATGTYSAITATITNSTNTAGTGSLTMREADSAGKDFAAGACSSNGGPNNTTNSFTCASVNKYGGSSTLTPGGAASSTTVQISDTGTLDPAAFSITPGACAPSNNAGATDTANNICTQLKLTLTCQLSAPTPATTVTIYTAQTLSSIANKSVDLKAAGCLPLKNGSITASFTFSVQLDSGAQNGVQGTSASQPIVWQFTA